MKQCKKPKCSVTCLCYNTTHFRLISHGTFSLLKSCLICFRCKTFLMIRDESNIDFCMQCVIVTQTTRPPRPNICVISRILTKSIVF